MGFDQELAGMDAKEAEELEAKLLVLQGKSGAKKAYRNARQDFSTQMSRYFRGKENDLIKRLRKRFENEDLTPEQIAEEADNIAKDKNLNVKEKKALVKVLTDYGKKIETARKAAQEDSKLQDQYRTELMNKFGGKGYDFTNGRDVNNALNAVHKDRIAKESTAYKDEAEKAIEASKKIDEDKLVYLKKVYGVTQSIGSMIAKKFGFDPSAFAILGTSETGDVPQNTLTNVKNDSKAESENKEKDKAKNNVSTTTTDAEGNIWKTATDGSKVLVGSEANADKKRAKDAEDKKQQGWFASIGDKLKGFVGLGGKKEKKEEGGFLHNLADSLMGKSGALFSILKGGALAAIAGPLIIKALPIITQFLKDNKDAIIDAGKEVFKGIVEMGKEAVGMIFDSIADSFKNGDFATGLLQIIAGAFIGNKMLGGLPGMVLSKGGGMLYDRFKNRNKGKEEAPEPEAPTKETTTKNTEAAESNKKGKKGKRKKGKRKKGKRSKQKNKAAKMSENANTAATAETKAATATAEAVAESGGKSGSKGKGKWGSILSGISTAAGFALPFLSESAAEAAEESGGIYPGQLYAVNENNELELIDENGRPITDGDQESSDGGFMDTLSTILDIKDSVSDFFKKDTPDVSLGEEAGSIAEDTKNTKPKGTGVVAKFTQKMGEIKSKAMNKITPITESISNAASKTKGVVKGMSDKALKFLKNLLTAGIDKVKSLLPGLSKKLSASMVQKLASQFIATIVKNGPKFMTKIAAQIGVAMTGVGAIAVAIVNLVSAFDNIYNEGWKKWYNNADVLYNEDLGDDVKYISVLAGAISTLLYSVIPVKWVFKALAAILGLDLSQAQARAQEAVDDYNADKESHPEGAPDTVADVEEYNAMYEKGLLDSVKETGETLLSFGKDTLTKMNQAAKNIYEYVGDKATAAKNWAKNNAKWLAENGMNWFKQAYNTVATTAANLKDNAVKYVKDKYDSAKQTLGDIKDEASARASNVADAWNNNSGTTAVVEAAKAAVTDSKDYKKDKDAKQQSTDSDSKPQGKHGLFGRGYYKQTQYSNIGFNIPGDTIRQTIGDSGCGPVAAVNAIQALGRGTGSNDPVIQASNFALQNGFKGKDTGTDPRFFGSYAASQGIGSKDTDKSDVKSELSKGNSVVIEGEDPKGESSKNPFAEYPHYVTATGYNAKNGTVTIQDPESNKDNSQYKLSEVLNKTNSAITFFKPAKQTTRKDVPKWYGMKTMGEGKRRFAGNSSVRINDKTYKLNKPTGKRFGRGGDVPGAIWDFLTSHGIGSVLTAAIMGNIEAECSYDPAAVEDNGVGHGICQWSYERCDNLMNFAASRNTDWSDLNTQLEFLWTEIVPGGPESAAVDKCKDITDVAQCTEAWCRAFERPSGAVAHLDRRIASAQEAFEKQGHGVVTGTNVKGGKTSGNTAQAPQNSYGIFDAIMKPFDQLNSSLGQVMGGITSDGPFKQMSDISTKIFGSMIGGAAPQQPQQQGSRTTKGGQSGYGVQGGLRGSGFDDKYIEVNGPEEQTALIPVQDIVKEKFNGMAKAYFEKTGDKLMITGGAEGGGIHADGTYGHPNGWKLDVAKPLSDPDYFVQLGRDYNVAVGNEDDAHYDLGFGADNVGGDNLSDCHPNAGQGKHGLGKHGLLFGRGGKSSNKAMNAMGKSISSANKRYGKGIISDTLKSAFNSGALNGSIQGIVGKVTGGNKDISNILDQVLPTPQTDATTTDNTDLSQAGVIELLKIAVQLLTTIATNTGNMGSMSKEAVEKQQASINSAINSIGQMMAASNQSMMNGVSQMISSNNGMSYEQQHMSLSLDQLAAL